MSHCTAKELDLIHSKALLPLHEPEPTQPEQSISSMLLNAALPCTKNGHTAILVVVDKLSKITHLIPHNGSCYGRGNG